MTNRRYRRRISRADQSHYDQCRETAKMSRHYDVEIFDENGVLMAFNTAIIGVDRDDMIKEAQKMADRWGWEVRIK